MVQTRQTDVLMSCRPPGNTTRCVPCGVLENNSKTKRANCRATTHVADFCSRSWLCGRASTCLEKSSRNLRHEEGDGFRSVSNEEIDSNTLDVVGAELHILDDVQTYDVVRIHDTLPLYGESCEPDTIVCVVNMTSPAGAAEQLAGGFDSSPGGSFWIRLSAMRQTLLKEKHTTMPKTQR